MDAKKIFETANKLRSEGKLLIPTKEQIENEPTALAFTYNEPDGKIKCTKIKNIISITFKSIALIFGIIPIILAIPSVIIYFIAEQFEFIDSSDVFGNDIKNLKQDNILKESDYAEAYDNYCSMFLGYDDVPTIDWFIHECKNNENFRNKFLNNMYNI